MAFIRKLYALPTDIPAETPQRAQAWYILSRRRPRRSASTPDSCPDEWRGGAAGGDGPLLGPSPDRMRCSAADGVDSANPLGRIRQTLAYGKTCS